MRYFVRAFAAVLLLAVNSCSCGDATGPSDDDSEDTPPVEGTAQGKVVLPTGTSITVGSLTVTTLEQQIKPGSDGSYQAKVKTESGRPTLVIASTAAGEPVLLAYSTGTGTTDLDVASTAKALSSFMLNALPLSSSLRSTADAAILAHTEFTALKAAITKALTDEPAKPLTGKALEELMSTAALIATDVYSRLDVPAELGWQSSSNPWDADVSRAEARYNWRSYITIEDDAGHNKPDVSIMNHSMAWYRAVVSKDGAPVSGSPFMVERNKVHTYHWNNFVSGGSEKLLKPGDGVLAFRLTVDRETTILDPFVNALIGMIGLTGNLDMVKMKGCMDAVSANLGLINELAKVGEKWRGSNYTTPQYVSELATAVTLEASQLMVALKGCLEGQVTGEASKSLVAKIGTFLSSKAWAGVMMGLYGADISSAVWSAVNALPGDESGRQKDGRYPAIAVTVTPASSSAQECSALTWTATYDNKVITGAPSFEWSITGPKTHWTISTGSTPTLTLSSFPEPGLFTVLATVSAYDAQNTMMVQGEGGASAQISPCNIPNLLAISPASVSGRPGREYSWTVSGGGGFVTPPRYVWTFGDNSAPFVSDATTARHTYATEGTYAIRVEALDMSDRNAYRGQVRGYGTAQAEMKRPVCTANSGSASGSWPPSGEFNGLSIAYSFTGGKLDAPKDTYSFHTRRDYTGALGTGDMTLSGTFKSTWTPKVQLTVRLNAGGVQKDTTFQHDTYATWQQAFNLTLPIPKGATTGSFTVTAYAAYGNGEGRTLSVNGSLECGGG